MKVIHISSDFARQKVYDELISRLDHIGISKQFVYVPVRSDEEIGRNRNLSLRNTDYRFIKILRPYHRLLFRLKIATVFSDLVKSIEVSSYSVAHAHFLYSDGAVALRLKQKLGIPYVVAVRNTDINFFMKYRPDLFPLCQQILEQASFIIFITPAYLDRLLERVPSKHRDQLRDKSRIVPNGVSNFWLDHPPDQAETNPSPIRLLYVGDFSRNKNVPNTIRAAEKLQSDLDVRLTLVGGGRNGEKEIRSMLDSGHFPFVTYLGRIESMLDLAAVYRRHDIFVMPSYSETFGVAYIEALSQGLPIVHSIGQGVDGYFEEGTVSEAVDPASPVDIARKIKALASRLVDTRPICRRQAKRFDWTQIAHSYLDIYQEAASADATFRSMPSALNAKQRA